jgi:hypothetical protein
MNRAPRAEVTQRLIRVGCGRMSNEVIEENVPSSTALVIA